MDPSTIIQTIYNMVHGEPVHIHLTRIGNLHRLPKSQILWGMSLVGWMRLMPHMFMMVPSKNNWVNRFLIPSRNCQTIWSKSWIHLLNISQKFLCPALMSHRPWQQRALVQRPCHLQPWNPSGETGRVTSCLHHLCRPLVEPVPLPHASIMLKTL